MGTTQNAKTKDITTGGMVFNKDWRTLLLGAIASELGGGSV